MGYISVILVCDSSHLELVASIPRQMQTWSSICGKEDTQGPKNNKISFSPYLNFHKLNTIRQKDKFKLFQIFHTNFWQSKTYPNVHLLIYEFSPEQIPHLIQDKGRRQVSIFVSLGSLLFLKKYTFTLGGSIGRCSKAALDNDTLGISQKKPTIPFYFITKKPTWLAWKQSLSKNKEFTPEKKPRSSWYDIGSAQLLLR